MLATFTGCGSDSGGSGSGGDSTSSVSAMFYDSAVQGLTVVKQDGSTEVTSSTGAFSCDSGETLEFKIGSLKIGEATCASIITPLTLANTTDRTNSQAVNIGVILQSLDASGTLGDGIQLTATAQAFSGTTSIDLTDDTAVDNIVATLDGSKSAVTRASVAAHFNASLGSDGSYTGTITTEDDNMGGNCPTNLTITVNKDDVTLAVTGTGLDLSDFNVTENRNLDDNSMTVDALTSDSGYDVGVCGGSAYSGAELKISGSINVATDVVSGSYTFKNNCGVNPETQKVNQEDVCKGTFSATR